MHLIFGTPHYASYVTLFLINNILWKNNMRMISGPRFAGKKINILSVYVLYVAMYTFVKLYNTSITLLSLNRR